jgi:hypothetical protein
VDAVVTGQFEQVCAVMEAADDPAADTEDRLFAVLRAYVRWGLENPGAYQLVFERPAPTDDAILLMSSHGPTGNCPPDEAPTEGPEQSAAPAKGNTPGFGVICARLMGMCHDAGMTAAQAQDHVVRWWAMAHGLTSLRLHKPAGLWQHDVDADVRALVALTSPTAAVHLHAEQVR